MDTRKLEHIVIIILLLLNIFLLALAVSDDAEDRRSRRETEALLTALLADNGVAVGPGAELIQAAPAERTVVRDMALEEQRMEGLLGTHTAEDLGGSIWFYRSPRGQLVMRGTGELDYLPEGAVAERGRDPAKSAARLFRGAGVTLDAEGASVTDGGDIALCCCWGGYPVYNAVLSFSFSGERLGMVTGTMVFDRETGESGAHAMDSASVLVRFVELTKSEGLICSELTALTPGYYMTVTVSGESTLTPVWRIGTDTGDVYINAVSGRLESVAAPAA